MTSRVTTSRVTTSRVIRMLSLGDSYTIGESVCASERWPMQLAAMMRARGLEVAEPKIVAQTGWTTDELLVGLASDRPTGRYDIVTLLIGVNNQYRGRTRDEYDAELRALLARATAFAGDRPSRVFVVSIPDWGVTPFAAGRDVGRIAAEIDAFNDVKRAAAARAGAQFVDITAISRRAAAEPALLAADGLHPSGAMYEEWARLMLPRVCAAL